jgi:hypothetical protein
MNTADAPADLPCPALLRDRAKAETNRFCAGAEVLE